MESASSSEGAQSSLVMDEASNIDQLSYKVRAVFWPYIKKTVKFSHLMTYMPFMRNVQMKIFRAEKLGDNEGAADIFLQTLQQSEEEGKYQTFVNALRAHGYTFLVDVLTDKREILSKQEEHKEVIHIFSRQVGDTIDPTLIAQELLAKSIIFSDDADRIKKAQSNDCTRDAVLLLLDALPRREEN
ncbi:uncharacterized protein LOC101858480 isoform X2 [Aplysia californica]|nr:uncharacterized protein LOC101858480 isoform X2 [Aplysia californica]